MSDSGELVESDTGPGEDENGPPATEVTKWSIRQQIWDHIEKNDLANFPRPVHHRIPNFKNAAAAAEKITALKPFQQARFVKVNPDKPQENVRFLIMEAGKTLLVPTPRLRNGLFNRITPPAGANKQSLRTCATRQGVDKHSIPVGLDDMVKIDLVVCGSVAVSRKGYRIGKGEGFGDMEWAMLVTMGAVTPDTVIVTTVHDCQVIDIPDELVESHDITVDWILTPTEVIQTNCQRPKPLGIIWSKVGTEMLQQIPILRKLREKERTAGKDVQIKAEGEPGEAAKERGMRRQPRGKPRERRTSEKRGTEVAAKPNNQGKQSGGEARRKPPRETDPSLTLWVGKLPGSLRVSSFKDHLRESDVNPHHVIWKGNRGFAFLQFKEADAVDEAVKKLQDLEIMGKKVTVERAKGREDMEAKRPMKKADSKPKEKNAD
ncbi:MTHFSD [Branchiostoma lanceolatum]|uniref:Methenyltetrahydrofolate synthase domain-containing protein n=1 Tax=Branchiostoma lanceolatum TaxID=7740 RepID=A0A8J9ZSF8_BRALA|nr:MTHFSD [Branchiostoma lanceolatum]